MHCGLQTQSCWGIRVVSLVRVLDLSPSDWSVLEVTQRWLVLSGTRSPGPSPVFRTSAPLVIFASSPCVSQALIRVANAVDTMWHILNLVSLPKKTERKVEMMEIQCTRPKVFFSKTDGSMAIHNMTTCSA